MDKENVTYHTLEYDSASQRKEVLTQATAWMGLGDVLLSEVSQSQKDTDCVMPVL